MAEISPDEFETWRASPVTQWVMDAIRLNAEGVSTAYEHAFFANMPTVDSIPLMNQMRGEYAACMTIVALKHEDVALIYENQDIHDEHAAKIQADPAAH